MEFGVLGPLVVRNDAGTVDIGGARQRRLLAVLLANAGRIVPLERLVEMVFDGEPPRSASTTMRSYVARLRRALTEADPAAGALVATEQGGYGLRVDLDHIDAARFEASIETAQGQLARRDPIAAAATLRQGLELWRGDAYGEFANEEWAHAEAMRLDELRTVAREELNESLLACGLANDVISEARAQIDLHPLRERLRSQHMLALYRAGRQVEALRSLDEFEEALVDVGLEPSAELRALGSAIAAHDPALRLDTPAGQPLRGYRVGASIGEGAHGVVYRAVQPGVGREVAVKTIRAQLADDPEFVRGFDAEAQLVANLEHPHIVPIYDYWREPGGAYIVMRLLDGNLGDRLENGPMEVSSVSSIARELGSALHSAHRAGVVHGDIKPTNVLVDDERAYLADFGVATLIDSTVDGPSGSPSSGFESPEMLAGQPATPASDQFAFAVLLFQLLTGTLPFGTRAIATAHDRAPAVHVQRPSVPAAVDDVLWQATRWEATERFADVEAFVSAFVSALEGGDVVADDLTELTNPYKGLEAFTEADHANFFGRRSVTDELLSQLDRPGPAGAFVIAVGASGSGKSSVVRAGLVPRLRAGAIEGSERWLVATMIPGVDPFASLQQALRAVATDADRPVSVDFGAGPFEQLLRGAVPHGLPVLLVIDQLEELFTLVADDRARRDFIDGLVEAVEDPDSGVRIAATMRADFLDRPLRFADFGRLVKRGAVTIVGMSAAEISDAIMQPAARAGVEVEPALVTQIVSDVVDQPAALPLLQFALTELFEIRTASGSRDRRMMTLADYRSLGGIDAAIARRADGAVAVLPEAGRDLARRVFLRLVSVDDGNAVSRRRVRRTQLTAMANDGGDVERLLDTFAAARLLTFDHDPETREPTVEVAHEALIHQWPQFQQWVSDAGDDLRVHQQIAAAAATWDEQGRDDSDVARGMRLESALELVESAPEVFSPLEREFVAASGRHRAAEVEAERAQAEQERRSNRRLRGLLAGVGALLVVAVVAGIFAITQRNDAREQTEVAVAAAESAELATIISRSAAAVSDDPEVAVLLALEANRRAPSPETEQAVLNALGSSPLAPRLASNPPLQDPSCDRSVIGSDGFTNFAVLGGELVALDLLSGERTQHGPSPAECLQWVGDATFDRKVAFSGDGRVWAGPFDGPFDTERTFDAPTFGILSSFRPTGRWYVVTEPDEGPSEIFVIDDRTLETIGEPITIDDRRFAAELRDDGSLFAVAFGVPGRPEGDGEIVVFDGVTAEEQFRVAIPLPVEYLVFDEFSPQLLGATLDGRLITIDLESEEVVADVGLTGTSFVTDMEVGSDGLVTVVSAGQLEVVDRLTGPVGQPVELRDVVDARLRPDGLLLSIEPGGATAVISLDSTVLVDRSFEIDAFAQSSINDGRVASAAFGSAPPEVVDLVTGQRTPLEFVTPDGSPYEPFIVLPEGDGVWTYSFDRAVTRWEDGAPVASVDTPGAAFATSFLDDRFVVMAWDERPGTEVAHLVALDPREPTVLSVDLPDMWFAHPSADGGLHAVTLEGTLSLFDAAGAQVGEEIDTGVTEANVFAVDTASGRVALASPDGSGAAIVDHATGEVRRVGGADAVANMGFAQDGRYLVLTSGDGTVRLWDVERDASAGLLWDGNGARPLEPSWYDEASDSVWVSTSGRVIEIPLDPAVWIERACAAVSRELTELEWERLVPGDDEQVPSPCA